ncbi:molybdenum cofactor guanylyltransferase MobA [Staphylococcus carnosus]|uniref:molybdenum cofactor guanylyltransferase MobA n=1 Tax=Staphylococcus carnosus TaxID=1281 RepID=UPI0020A5B6F3|nr:molybdenum cofactor guanylyltransferase MobA [Staphylococcus carnosus]UTB80096.1 molybdenum cofactor guanylyltransferase MobA [Staphylococcus carnosus]
MKAIILAGGQSERFGAPKAFAEIDGKMFYEQIITVLDSMNMFNEIIISSNETLASEFKGARVIVDDSEHKNKGPLSGIYSVMKQDFESELFFVISVDTPLITAKAISQLYQFMVEHVIEDQLDITGFKEGNHPIPTIAFYSPNCLPIIARALESDDYSMRHVYQQTASDWIDVSSVDDDTEWYKNINYPQDLESIKK